MFFLNILILKLFAFVVSDITVNYQSMKYSHVYLEVNYTTVNGFIYEKLDLTKQNPLITVLNQKKDVVVYGRLIMVMNKFFMTDNLNKAQYIKIAGGCSKITTVSEIPWIALIYKGGQCSLKEKLSNALSLSNASAVIILDDSMSRNVEKYEFSNYVGLRLTDLAIPIYILMNESIFINASIIINNDVMDGLISRTSVLFVSISFILLMIISLVWLTFYYIQRFRYMHAKERLSRRLANAAKKALHKIPLKTLSLGDTEVSYDFDQCAICIDNYQVGETIRILPCKHIFHKVCIDSWLIEQRSCPMCKVDILKACGIIGLTSNKNSVNRPALLDNGLISSDPETGDSSTFDAVESNMNTSSRCRRGKSNFLQRYRERYGLHHYYQGHIKNHCHRYTEHCHRKSLHHCPNHRDKFRPSVDLAIDSVQMPPKTASVQIDTERLDLISESDNSISSLHQIQTNLSNSKEGDKVNPQLILNCGDLHEISQGLVCDICECNSENAPTECDICGSGPPNHSTSTSYSCESCDCYILERECGEQFNGARNNNNRFGNLLGCCVASEIDRHGPISRNSMERSNPNLCCYNLCSHCRNQSVRNCHIENEFAKNHNSYKEFSSKTHHCKMNITDSHNAAPVKLADNSINVNQFAKKPSNNSYFTRIGCRKTEYDNVKKLKTIQLSKNMNKCVTIDSYTKSSLSDEFDFETDGGSSSLEIATPFVKLTVLPPQVQYHQGSPNSNSSHSSSGTAEMNILEETQKYDDCQESENSKSESIVRKSLDQSSQT